MTDQSDEEDEFYAGQIQYEPPPPPPPEKKAVGYASPPEQHQFKKGQSGNPYGRPKKVKPFKPSPSLLAALAEELAAPMPVMVRGKKVLMSKDQVLMKRLVADLLTDDPRIRYRAMDQMRKLGVGDAVEAIRNREEERQSYEDREEQKHWAAMDETLEEAAEILNRHDYYQSLAIMACSCGAMASYKEGKPELIVTLKATHPDWFPDDHDGPETRSSGADVRSDQPDRPADDSDS